MFADIVACIRFTLPVRWYPVGPSLRHLVWGRGLVLVPHELMASVKPLSLDSGAEPCPLVYGQAVVRLALAVLGAFCRKFWVCQAL